MLSNELCTTVNPVTSAGVTVSVLPPLTPSVSLSVNDSTLCGNDAPVFNASFVNGGTNPLFNWFVDGVLSATSSLPSFIPNGLSSGQVVSVQLVSSYLCASPVNVLSSGISVTFTPNPVVNAGADVRVLLGNSVQLNATNDTGWVYFWSPAAGLSCTSCSNPVATPTATTTYAIEVTDQASGCTGSDTIVVEVYEQTDVFIPTAFSPNKDGANDVLFVRGNGIRDFELVIYNRNGEAVFRTSSQAEGWDGTYKGQDLDSGVFHYVLTGTFSSGESISQSGNVSICR
jgi:gliding motility-associated-like protein